MTIKLMSLGYNCTASQILKELGLREPGPVDWALQMDNNCLMHLAAGDLFQAAVNHDWSVFYNYADKGYITEFPQLNIRLAHEILTDNNTLCKFIIRCVHFMDKLKYGGGFLYYQDERVSAKDIYQFLELTGLDDSSLFIIGDDRIKCFPNHLIVDLANTDIKYRFWNDVNIHNSYMKMFAGAIGDWLGVTPEYKEVTSLSTWVNQAKFDGTYNTKLVEVKY